MANLTLKNLPPELHRALKRRAKAHHRSLNREVVATLESLTNQTRPIDTAALIQEAREVRKRFKRQVTPAEIKAWIRDGRS